MSLSEVDNRELEALTRRVEGLLARNPSGTSAVPRGGITSIFVEQTAHGFERGQAVIFSQGGEWVSLNSTAGDVSLVGGVALWGIVDRARTDSFSVTVSGVAVIPGETLTPGAFYAFEDGEAVELTGAIYRIVSDVLIAQAIDATHVFVQSSSVVKNPYSQHATFMQITMAAGAAVLGDFIALDNTNNYILALADAAHPDKANILGCVVYSLDVSGPIETLLLATEGVAEVTSGSDLSGRWPVSSGHPARYLSDSNAGRTVDVAPSFAVLACYGAVTAGVGGSSSGSLRLSGPGRMDPLKIPLDLAHGGTGADLSTGFAANSVVVVKSTGDQLFGILNSAPAAFLTQASGGVASWTTPDAAVFQIAAGALKLKDGTALGQFLRWSGTAWAQYGPLISTLGDILSSNGTDLVTTTGGTALSVLGNPTNAPAVPTAIASAGADKALVSTASALSFGQVTRATLVNGAACSVVGRSANSSGVVADIAAGSDGLFLTRAAGALTWAAASVQYLSTFAVHTGSNRDFTAIVGYGGYSSTSGDDLFQFRFYSTAGLGAPSAYTDGALLWSYKVMSSDPFLINTPSMALASPGLSVGNGTVVSLTGGGKIGLANFAGGLIVGQSNGGPTDVTGTYISDTRVTSNIITASVLHATSAFSGTIAFSGHSFTFVDGICTTAS